MSNQNLPVNFAETVEFTIPPFNDIPPKVLFFSKIRNGEKRLVEARVVNGGTYADLEYTFNEGYREAKKNLSVIGYEITLADREVRRAKSIALIDEYSDWLKDNKGLKDSAAVRDAFLEQQKPYTDALDRVNMLKALESLLEGKVKVFEKVCQYMRKSMDIEIRSGVSNNKY